MPLEKKNPSNPISNALWKKLVGEKDKKGRFPKQQRVKTPQKKEAVLNQGGQNVSLRGKKARVGRKNLSFGLERESRTS